MKIVFYILAAVLLVFGVVPTFLSPTFFMSRKIEINAPVRAVHTRLTDLHEYSKWNPFDDEDPTSKMEVSGTGVGSWMAWQGEKSGEGKMTITRVDPDKEVEVQLNFIKPMPGDAIVYWTTAPAADGKTEMTWSYKQENSYLKRWFNLLMEPMMKGIFDRGLTTLKTQVEESYPSLLIP